MTSADGTLSYHCFNCGYKASWVAGRNLTFKLKRLMQWLNVPDDVMRQSIAVYYYTENTQGDNDVDFEGCAPRGTTWYPNIDFSTKPQQIFYV